MFLGPQTGPIPYDSDIFTNNRTNKTWRNWKHVLQLTGFKISQPSTSPPTTELYHLTYHTLAGPTRCPSCTSCLLHAISRCHQLDGRMEPVVNSAQMRILITSSLWTWAPADPIPVPLLPPVRASHRTAQAWRKVFTPAAVTSMAACRGRQRRRLHAITPLLWDPTAFSTCLFNQRSHLDSQGAKVWHHGKPH
jgi:hypothetical protein